MLPLNKSCKNRKVSLTIHCKYKYFDSTVQRAEDRQQKFYFCRLPFAVNVKLNLSIKLQVSAAEKLNYMTFFPYCLLEGLFCSEILSVKQISELSGVLELRKKETKIGQNMLKYVWQNSVFEEITWLRKN